MDWFEKLGFTIIGLLVVAMTSILVFFIVLIAMPEKHMDGVIDKLYIQHYEESSQYAYSVQVGSVSVPMYEDVPAHDDYNVSVKDLGEATVPKEDWMTFKVGDKVHVTYTKLFFVSNIKTIQSY